MMKFIVQKLTRSNTIQRYKNICAHGISFCTLSVNELGIRAVTLWYDCWKPANLSMLDYVHDIVLQAL